MKILKNKYVPFLIIIFVCILLQWKYFNEFPSHIHAWAQSDRYALALGFTQNGLDLFHPQTYILNHQFPGNFAEAHKTAITAVDFPIHDYLVALLMKLTGSNSPIYFHLYTFLYSLLGLFFLYLLAAKISKHKWLAFAITLFAVTSPVFINYQSGFLPTIPSLSNIFIACYLYVKYLSSRKLMYFGLTVLFLTLASLSRTPFAIFLISLFLTEMLLWKNNSRIQPKILKFALFALSFACIIGYFLYNQYLLKTYGSIFLNRPLPPNNLADCITLIKESLSNWFFQYFSIYHYTIILVLLVWGFLSIKKTEFRIFQNKHIIFFLFLSTLGCLCYSILMMKQFPAHDYYFLDTFFAPTLLIIILLINILKNQIEQFEKITFVVIVVFSATTVLNAAYSQKKRRATGYWDRTNITINNFQGSKALLDSISVHHNAKVLVIDAYAPNIPFILMNRTGYAVMTTSGSNIKNALKWDFDYIAIQNCFLVSDVINNYPDIINRITKVADNGKISIYKALSPPQNKSLMQFLELDYKTPLLTAQITFDSIVPPNWQIPQITSSIAFSGKNSGFTNKNEEFGITYKTKLLPFKENKSNIVVVRSKFLTHKPLNNCFIVVSINENDENIYYNAFNLNDARLKTDTWQDVQFLHQLPAISSSNYEFALYLWNSGKNTLWYDDFSLWLY